MHKNKDWNLTSIEASMFSRNNETININICLKKKWTDTFRERYPSLFFFRSQPKFKGLITRHRLTRFRD